jgi:hypothetical protein
VGANVLNQTVIASVTYMGTSPNVNVTVGTGFQSSSCEAVTGLTVPRAAKGLMVRVNLLTTLRLASAE